MQVIEVQISWFANFKYSIKFDFRLYSVSKIKMSCLKLNFQLESESDQKSNEIFELGNVFDNERGKVEIGIVSWGFEIVEYVFDI